jgi:SAM-dependent methyltransferase
VNNRYGNLASHVYNLDKYIGRSFGDVEYYRERLCSSTGPILEPAVGNGRVLIPLLEAGLEVVGFDASEEMLEHCRRECAARSLPAHVTRQTFADFAYNERFEAVIIPAGSFQLITDHGAAMATLQRVFDHLRPDGRLIVDVDPVGSVMSGSTGIRRWTTSDGDVLTLNAQLVETDFVAQTSVSQLRYDCWRAGQLAASELEFFSLRWWGVEELSLALRASGFVDVAVFGDYLHGQAPGKDACSITFEARRPA